VKNRATIIGLLAISVVIVAAIMFHSRSSSDPQGGVMSGAASGSSVPGETSYVPCGSCDARHNRLKKGRSGED
jgi:hypothetical protein